MPTRRALRLTVAALFATLVLASPAYSASGRTPALVPVAPDALTRALAAGELTEAQYALERARALFGLNAVRSKYGMVRPAGPRDATLVLRDLVARLHELSPAEQAAARRLLARPTDNPDPGGTTYSTPEAAPFCSTNGCIHYVTTTADAPDPVDANANAVPDYVEAVAVEFELVWAKEVVEYGYRPPKPDLTSTNHGPDGRIDVYIADIGDDGLYGYCTTDDPFVPSPAEPYYDLSAYCVIDDDYSPSQFRGAASGLAALQVTLAHEFAHAVQFAYDAYEDVWLLEGTAAWFEDEVYDDVNDNYQYLFLSPLTRPDVPLDLGVTDPSHPLAGSYYGTFVFFRYLSERLRDPSIMRAIWERADGSPAGPDDYSVQAIANALRNVAGIDLSTAFGAFAAANIFPALFYEEGDAYPTPSIGDQANLTAGRRTVSGRETLDHLTSAHHSLRPGAGVGANARLRVKFDLPPLAQGSRAALVVVRAGGGRRIVPVTLNAQGDGSATVAFGRGAIRAVRVVVANASIRYMNCWIGMPFACGGLPVDDDRVYRYTARLI
jgi:hypothetical protein